MTTNPDMAARRKRVEELFPELALISRPSWRQAVVDIWAELWSEGPWADPSDCPKSAKDVQDSSNVDHTRSVTLQALATADVVEKMHGVTIDRDVLVTAALLHDVSKLVEYEPGDPAPRASRTGVLMQHGVIAASKALQHGLPEEVAHILVSHTHQSTTVPATNESILIHYVDFLDSDVLLLARGKRLFAKA